MHGSRGFDAHHHQTFQGCIKRSYCIPFAGKVLAVNSLVFVSTMAMVCCFCVQIPAYNFQPPSSRAFFGWIPQSLLGPLWGRRRYDIDYVTGADKKVAQRVAPLFC